MASFDEEMLGLYAAAGGEAVCLGVESGDREVFKRIGKGESLRDIVETARLIRKNGLKLGLCFVIGLPGDNLQRHRPSMTPANVLKLDYIRKRLN